jgi:pyruvate/2-oxoglutarate dehydrogenase complex dihydrolipoamide acyltransferase (E2) component
VIDGADAARFLRWIADAFVQPFVLALCANGEDGDNEG